MFRVQLIFDVVKISIFQNFVLREIDHQSYCQKTIRKAPQTFCGSVF